VVGRGGERSEVGVPVGASGTSMLLKPNYKEAQADGLLKSSQRTPN
jgi:hypothetical protein